MLKQTLIDRTEGNPFFLEECIRTLEETRALTGERGAYRAGREVQSIQIPATVQSVLAARVDRLPIEARRLLQAAAVIGMDVPLNLLQEIVDVPEDLLRRSLTQLQSAEFLYEVSLFPTVEYTFKHALTQDVAYSTLLQERRRDAARPHRGGHRAPACGASGRARGAPRPSRVARGGVGQGCAVPASGRVRRPPRAPRTAKR